MAVTDFATVQHIPFPSLRSARSLEPDGIALFAIDTIGDGSGGNVLVTIRADQSEFLYVLKSLTFRVNTSVANPGPVIAILNPEWLQDISNGSGVFDIEAAIPLVETTSTNWRPLSRELAGFLKAGETVPVGKIEKLQALTTTNIALFNYPTNTNSALYSTVGTFYMYRREALTVPGFLEALVSPALIR